MNWMLLDGSGKVLLDRFTEEKENGLRQDFSSSSSSVQSQQKSFQDLEFSKLELPGSEPKVSFAQRQVKLAPV